MLYSTKILMILSDFEIILIIICLYVLKDRPLEEYRAELGKFGVQGEMALQPIVSLSGGQKSRVAFALLAFNKLNLVYFSSFYAFSLP